MTGREYGERDGWTKIVHFLLQRMRSVLPLLLFSILAVSVAGESQRWTESSMVYATFAHTTDSDIVAAVDAALSPLQFRRETTGTRYPGNLVPGIFASYAHGDLAKGLLVEAAVPGCIVFSVSNYARESAGLPASAVANYRARLGEHFGENVTFYSDAMCRNAL